MAYVAYTPFKLDNEKMKILFIAIAFVFLWLVIWPTVEVREHFDTIVVENESHEVALEFRPSQVSNNSRLLHKITSGTPYWFGVHISPTKNTYDEIRIENVRVIDSSNDSHFEVSKLHVNMDFFNSEGATIPTIRKPSDYDGYMELKPGEYQVIISYKLCEKNNCDKFEIRKDLSFSRETKFYSETFSQMMGI